MLDKVKKQIEIVPLYTISLVFLGYWNLYTYYKHFNIDIYYYVTTGELLLGFLSISVYLFYVVSVFVFFYSFASLQAISNFIHDNKIKDDPVKLKQSQEISKHMEEHNKNYFNLIFKVKEFFNKSNYENRSILYNLFLTLLRIVDLCSVLLIVVVLPIYCLLSFYDILKDKTNIFTNYQLIAFSLGFLLIYIFSIFNSYFEKIPNEKLKNVANNYTKLILVIYGLVLFIMINNYRKAFKVITHHPISEVKFQIDSTKFITSDSLYYIGQTQNFLFLKDMKKEDIMIFNKANIKNFYIKNLD